MCDVIYDRSSTAYDQLSKEETMCDVIYDRSSTAYDQLSKGFTYSLGNHMETQSSSTSSNPFDLNQGQKDFDSFKNSIPERKALTKETARRSRRSRFKTTAVSRCEVFGHTETARRSRRSRFKTIAVPRCEVFGHTDDIIRNTVLLVKSYGLLKEDLQKKDAISMSKQLFPHDGKLTVDIEKANKRRKAVDILLKKVLDGSEETKTRFIEVLKTGENRTLFLEKLDKKQVTDSDIKAHLAVNLDVEVLPERRLKFSKMDYETLKWFLKDEDNIDKINDQFLSRFIFTVDQHSSITYCDDEQETKVMHLLDTMALVDMKIYEDFRQILQYVKLESILKNLEQEKERQTRKRVHISGIESEDERSYGAKKCRFKKDLTDIIIRENNKNDTSLKSLLEDKLGCKDVKAESGSIVITFSPEGSNSWENLRQFCRDGKVRELILNIFDTESIHEQLPDGQFNMKLTIYEIHEGSKKAKLVLDNSDETTDKAIPDDEVSKVLLEELDITEDLLGHLKSNKIVSSHIDEKIAKQQHRKNKVACILQEVRQHGQEGYDVLQCYIERENKYLYRQFVEKRKLTDIDTALKQIPTEHQKGQKRTKGYQKEFFSCDVVLAIRTEEASEGASRTKKILSCPEIYNMVLHSDESDDTNMNEDLRMKKELRSDARSPDIACKKQKQSEKTNVKERRSGRRLRQKKK